MSNFIYHSKAVWLPLFLMLAATILFASIVSAQEIQWHKDLAKAKAEAGDSNRLVWLHFTADWCVPCKRLESFVFSSVAVIRVADQNTVAVKIDADAQASLVKQLDVPRIPYDVVMTPSGRVILSRPSPKDTASYLKMLNGLDRPLQGLTEGDREVINARIDKLHGVIKRSGGLSQKNNNIDLDGPSHKMAPTTVEGQRLERGFESAQRTSEIRAVQAKLQKQKAARFIAEEEQRQQGPQGPKFTENPFFKSSGGGDNERQTSNNSFPTNQSRDIASSHAKTVTNRFVKQDSVARSQSMKLDSGFVPPLPPTFGKNLQEKTAAEAKQKLAAYEDRNEFDFGTPTPQKPSVTAQKADTAESKPLFSLATPKLSLPQFADPKESLPSLSGLKDRSAEKTDNNNFAFAPSNQLNKFLPAEVKPNVTQNKRASFAKLETPEMETIVSVPKAPVKLEGVVKIAETVVPAIEGRLVVAEQPANESSMVKNVQAQSTVPKLNSPSQRLLENVNFFAPDPKPVQPDPRTFGVPVQAPQQPQAQQPQIVINLNAGDTPSPQPAQPAAQGAAVQPNQTAAAGSVAQTPAVRRAKISDADIASAIRSKYALKGKCPVTLLSEGRWVDGKKEIGCVHRDRVYLFTTPAHREAFLADPDRLSPLLAGFDPVIFEETGKLVEGDEKFGTFMGKKPNQRIVLFKTSDTRERFQKEPSKYLDVVRSAMTDNAPKDLKLR